MNVPMKIAKTDRRKEVLDALENALENASVKHHFRLKKMQWPGKAGKKLTKAKFQGKIREKKIRIKSESPDETFSSSANS